MDTYKSRLETEQVQFSFPWDKFTFRGFVVAITITIVALLIFSWLTIKLDPPRVYQPPQTVPIVLLSIGPGDGTGASKGNLTQEGAAQKGAEVKNPLQDAQSQGSTVKGQVNPADPMTTTNLTPINKMTGESNNTNSNDWGASSIGTKNGSANGTGLGDKGNGKGKGLGWGDIDWGGGGNRIVESKKEPTCPAGTQLGARITMKFTVLPDGSVSNVYPVVKGVPALEEAARTALKKWRFNKISQNINMEGKITFVFRLN